MSEQQAQVKTVGPDDDVPINEPVERADPFHALYFTAEGIGPTMYRLRLEKCPPRHPRDRTYFGIRREVNDLCDPKAYYDAGGYMISRTDLETLHRQIGEFLASTPAEQPTRIGKRPAEAAP